MAVFNTLIACNAVCYLIVCAFYLILLNPYALFSNQRVINCILRLVLLVKKLGNMSPNPNIWGFSSSDSKCDDCDMVRQMRSLYGKSDTFSYCSTDGKVTLFQSYCTHYIVCFCGPIIRNQHLQRFVLHSVLSVL